MRRKTARFELPGPWEYCISLASGVALGLNWTGLRSGDALIAWVPVSILMVGLLAFGFLDGMVGVRMTPDRHRWGRRLVQSGLFLATAWLTIPLLDDRHLRLLAFGLFLVGWLPLGIAVVSRPLKRVDSSVST